MPGKAAGTVEQRQQRLRPDGGNIVVRVMALTPRIDHAGDPPAVMMDLRDAAAGAQDAPLLLQPAGQQLQERPHAMAGPGKALDEDALEDGAEGLEIHVDRPRIAIVHHRHAQHVAQTAALDILAQPPAGGPVRAGVAGIGLPADGLHQRVKAGGVIRELRVDLSAEGTEVVFQPQRIAGEDDLRVPLRDQIQPVALDAQLPQHPVEGRVAVVLRDIVGQGMQPDVDDPPVATIPGIEAADHGVLFEKPHRRREMRGADRRGQPGQAAANDNEVVMRHRLPGCRASTCIPGRHPGMPAATVR